MGSLWPHNLAARPHPVGDGSVKIVLLPRQDLDAAGYRKTEMKEPVMLIRMRLTAPTILVVSLLAGCSSSQTAPQTNESRIGPLGFTHGFASGYPTKETVERLYDERDFQRACQLYLWAIPAVSFAQWQQTHASFGAWNGDIAALLSFDDRLGVLTPNATTPYYLIFADLTAGPFVIDMPPNVRGAISGAWQQAIPDTNRSARYLLLGPGQEPPADVAGFEVRRSPTYNINVGVRITTTDPKEAAALLAQLRAYPYAQRANPPAPKVVSPQGKHWSTMPPRGMAYWKRLDGSSASRSTSATDSFTKCSGRWGSRRGNRSTPTRGTHKYS
jgi:hypothetical protein